MKGEELSALTFFRDIGWHAGDCGRFQSHDERHTSVVKGSGEGRGFAMISIAQTHTLICKSFNQ